jgi:formylglycine-generating enzyme required for sulfatase activity
VSDVGAFDMSGNVSELTADFVPTASQIGFAGCVSPPYCILERGGSFEVLAGPDAAQGSIAAVSFGPDIGFRAAR